MNGGLSVDDETWDQKYTGTGLTDSAAQILKSIQDGDGLSIAANTGAAALDVLGFVENPLKAIGVSTVGWLIEHVSFLDWFLDRTVGDPNAVQNATDTFFRAAQSMDAITADQVKSFDVEMAEFRVWGSPSAKAFEKSVGPRADELKTMSMQCLALGSAMNRAGMLVATVRGMMRDVLAEFTWWVLKKAAIALASATYTGGTSLVALVTDAVRTGAKVARKLAADLADMVGQLGGLFAKLRKLAGLLDSPVATAAATMAQNLVPSVAKMADDQVELTATTNAEQEGAQAKRDAAAAKQRADDTGSRKPDLEIDVPGVDERKEQGPGLPSTWQVSGTLDD